MLTILVTGSILMSNIHHPVGIPHRWERHGAWIDEYLGHGVVEIRPLCAPPGPTWAYKLDRSPHRGEKEAI